MTRFKKELIKRGVQVEETLPFLPYENIEAIIVHSDTCVVSVYDNRIGWVYRQYGRDMNDWYKQKPNVTFENIIEMEGVCNG